MINIAICDDNRSFLRILKKHIEEFFSQKDLGCTVKSFTSGKELTYLGTDISSFDVVFLDVDMEEIDGIKTAGEIRKYSEDVIIAFVTAFIKYSPEGYKYNAIRYIMKDDELKESLHECLETIVKRIDHKAPVKLFSFREGSKSINLDKLMYIESMLHVLEFHVAGKENERYSMYGKLNDIYKGLKDYGFVRIHQSYLVNLKYITKLRLYRLNLENGEELSVSRSHYKETKNAYIAYKGEM